MRKIDKIILHCSATKPSSNVTIHDIREWHIARGWQDIGYHYVIDLKGEVFIGRNILRVGAHCKGENANSIGICYIGGLDDKTQEPKDTRTLEQKLEMLELVHFLMKKYNIKLENVYCHNQFANKACPCFSIEDFRETYTFFEKHNFFDEDAIY